MIQWRPYLATMRMGLYYGLFCMSLLHLALLYAVLNEHQGFTTPVEPIENAGSPLRSRMARDYRENSASAPTEIAPASQPLHLGVTTELEQFSSAAQQQALAVRESLDPHDQNFTLAVIELRRSQTEAALTWLDSQSTLFDDAPATQS